MWGAPVLPSVQGTGHGCGGACTLGSAVSPRPCLALAGDGSSRVLRLPRPSPLTSRPGEVCRVRAMATLTQSVNKNQQNNDFLIEISGEGERFSGQICLP